MTNYNRNLQAKIKEVADQFVKVIKRYVPTFSGKLKASIKSVINDDGFIIDALPYLDFLDKGVNGIKKGVGSPYSFTTKKPKITKSLKDWSKKKGLNVWAVQNSLYYNGLKPRKFLSKADTVVDISDLADAYSKDIDEQMFGY